MRRDFVYTKKELLDVFDGKKVSPYVDFCFEHLAEDKLVGNLSISGVQEKVSALVDDAKIRLVKNGEQGTLVLKPAPLANLLDRKEVPANEHLTMQLAERVYGLNTAKNTICYTSDGELVYVTRRFDVQGETKCLQEDFSVLTNRVGGGGQDFKYDGSYEDIARAIKQNIPSYLLALDEFFKLLVFNYIYANGDAHLKNFSILLKDGELGLAPAYDLINTAMHIGGDDLALKGGLSLNMELSDIYDRTGHLCKLDFERFGLLIGLPSSRIKKTIELFSTFPREVYELIEQSYLRTDKLKRKYIKIIEERQHRFLRDS